MNVGQRELKPVPGTKSGQMFCVKSILIKHVGGYIQPAPGETLDLNLSPANRRANPRTPDKNLNVVGGFHFMIL